MSPSAGGKDIALVVPATTNATAAGSIVLSFTSGTANQPKISGIEIINTAGSASGTPLQPPTGLTATAGDRQVVLNWTATSGAVSYNVFRGTSAHGEGTSPIAANVTATTFTDVGLTDGVTYFYTVQAVAASASSAQSTEVSATPIAGVAIPPVPTALTATAGTGQVSLKWSASTGATSYNVYRRTSSGAEASTPVATGIAAPAFVDTAVMGGATYYYTVAAVNSAGVSGKSNEASATPQPPSSTMVAVYQMDAGTTT